MKHTVLVCDDEPAILESVRYVVNKHGFACLLAEDGEQAMRIARTYHPDIIILDLSIPGMSGVDVCRKLKQDEDTSDIHIIILTANTQAGEIGAGMNAGANRYISKPFSPRGLGAILEEMRLEL